MNSLAYSEHQTLKTTVSNTLTYSGLLEIIRQNSSCTVRMAYRMACAITLKTVLPTRTTNTINNIHIIVLGFIMIILCYFVKFIFHVFPSNTL